MASKPEQSPGTAGHSLRQWRDADNKKSDHFPGSDAAIAAGCLCPVLDNRRGQGVMGMTGMFVFNAACPVHGQRQEPEA